MKNIKIISAGAGSGKTYRLTQEMVASLKSGEVRAGGIIATTFTKKAAAELQERVRVKLLEEGLTKEADELTHALIGTVHGLGVKLLKRFAYEAGVSPDVSIIAEEDASVLFNESLATVLTSDVIAEMADLTERLGFEKSTRHRTDWRQQLQRLTDVARVNGFNAEVLEESRRRSIDTFTAHVGDLSHNSSEQWYAGLRGTIEATREALKANAADKTKDTQKALVALHEALRQLDLTGTLPWYDWAKLGKLKVGAKSRELMTDLTDYVNGHTGSRPFRHDIERYISTLFRTAERAMTEYQRYKQRRGLVDYTDMEVLLNQLLQNEAVRTVLGEELDLLMVDEFQDTSPMQLALFWQLSKLAKQSVWVGDPKQSIYGFRGAEPSLMRAIVEAVGGIRPENILTHSWRSRAEVVAATNAIFDQAFGDLPTEQIALQPKRLPKAGAASSNHEDEPPTMLPALHYWHFELDDSETGRRTTDAQWLADSLGKAVAETLRTPPTVFDKAAGVYRLLRAGDVAVLCRSNKACQQVALGLHRAGVRAAISRSGLLATAEIALVLACLKFLLHKNDSLSIAEILLLAGDRTLEEITNDRMTYLAERDASDHYVSPWAADHPLIAQLNQLRTDTAELSSAEVLERLLSELDLRRLVVRWGNAQQRLSNIDVLRSLALQYEEHCNRLHTAASLSGWLLYLNELAKNDKDKQGSGESAEAVNVLTYHASKGLEWPLVVCFSLEGNLRDDVFGLHLQRSQDGVDLDDILGNRWLRLWVNPYADQYRNTALLNRLNASPAKEAARQAALEEEARLLYVGITRARDYLVFAGREGKKTDWLNRVYREGHGETPVLVPGSNDTPWSWNGRPLTVQSRTFPYPRVHETYALPTQPLRYLEARAGLPDTPPAPYHIDWKLESPPPQTYLRFAAPESYAPPIELFQPKDGLTVHRTLRYFLLGDQPSLPAEERTRMADHYRIHFEAEAMVSTSTLLDRGTAWQHYLQHTTGRLPTHRDYALRMEHQGRLFEATIASLVDTDEVVYAYHLHPYTKEVGGVEKQAEAYTTRLYYSRRALERLFPGKLVKQAVWFGVLGMVVEVA